MLICMIATSSLIPVFLSSDIASMHQMPAQAVSSANDLSELLGGPAPLNMPMSMATMPAMEMPPMSMPNANFPMPNMASTTNPGNFINWAFANLLDGNIVKCGAALAFYSPLSPSLPTLFWCLF